MKIEILTIFPEFFESPLRVGNIKRALDERVVEIKVHNLRDYSTDKHKKVDDYPYGGGTGMIFRIEPIYRALEVLSTPKTWRVLLSPQGRLWRQDVVKEYLNREHIILICGRYKGVDERVREHLVDDEISVGDYVLSGGEPAALVIIDSLVRLLPGVIGDIESALTDSFVDELLDAPHYTRPVEFMGWKVPEILLSGDHGRIEKWRKEKRKERTELWKRRRRQELGWKI